MTTDNTPLNVDDELFNDNFGAWLEYHGTDLEAQHTSGRWRAMIDLNKLKSAILQREYIGCKKHELLGAIKESERHTDAWGRERTKVLKQELEKL